MICVHAAELIHDRDGPGKSVQPAAMARYFFNLYECSTAIEDEEGRELPDVEAAHAAAFTEARQIMSDEVQAGRLCLSCRIDVRGADGGLVLTLPFREALKVTGL